LTRFRLKLTLAILSLISLVLLILGIYFAKVLERSYIETLTDLLRKQATLISEAVKAPEIFYNSTNLDRQISLYGETLEKRITVINREGIVLADTSSDPDDMENHANRPEMHDALLGETGVSTRYSTTLGYNMIYVAVPINVDGQIIGAVRSSMSMKSVATTIHHMWYSLVTGLIITLLVGLFISARIASGITRPIEEITRVARNITQREYESRVRLSARDEIGQLASAINFMASSLEQQMYEITENQQRLTGVLTNMPSGVILISENRRIKLVNPAVEKMLGMPRQQLEGKLHIEAGRNFGLSHFIDRCIDSGEKFREEVHIYYPAERILDVNLAPYINFKGEIKGVVAVLHDITEIRRLEKMRSDFVANVSHELRTPITSIKGFTETLLDGAMQDEEICRNFLQIISDESERLSRLITDILDLSKIEQKRIAIHKTEVDLQELIEDIALLVQDKVQRKKLTLELPENLHLAVQSDKDCLQQIILNLVANAIAYTPEHGKISVEVNQEGKHVKIAIADTGIGIPEKDLSRIFERFYRVDKARSRDSGGTGLGLAIVKHLVENLHGQIAVKSKEGEGSVFTVTLPVN